MRRVDIRQRLALNLKRLRAAKGLSQEAFAFEAGIHRTYVSDLERGARNPSITILDKLALPLGVDASALVSKPPEA
jgi:transcriptional regulator with XRE-family HTH domain